MGSLKVRFLSPSSADVFDAEIDDTLTASEAIGELVQHEFLVPPTLTRPYGLVRSNDGRMLLPQSSLGQAGVANGDVLEVVQASEGARSR